MNKYPQQPDEIIDLHGFRVVDVEDVLEDIMKSTVSTHVRLIVGKGIHSKEGPVIRDFVKRYLEVRNITFKSAKFKDGGEGALEVFF